jgi:hypothetical protein
VPQAPPPPVETGGIDVAAHGRKITWLVVAQPVLQVQGPVTVVVGTGRPVGTHEQGSVTETSLKQAGSAHTPFPKDDEGVHPGGVVVEVIVGHEACTAVMLV